MYTALGKNTPSQMNDIVTQVTQMNSTRIRSLRRANAVAPMTIQNIAVKAMALNVSNRVPAKKSQQTS